MSVIYCSIKMFFKINLTAGEVFLSTLNRVWPVLRSKSGIQLTVFRYEEYMVKGIYHTTFFVKKVNLFFLYQTFPSYMPLKSDGLIYPLHWLTLLNAKKSVLLIRQPDGEFYDSVINFLDRTNNNFESFTFLCKFIKISWSLSIFMILEVSS